MEISAPSVYTRIGRRKYLSRTEGQEFLMTAAHQPKMRAFYCLTLYYTGCRISEALAICPQDLDAALNVVSIRSLKKRHRHEVRRIPIPNSLTQQLLAAASADETQRLWRFSRTTGWRIVKETMKAAGIAGVHATTKGLRHAFGVRGALGGVPLNLIQQWMGHADAATTAIYLAVRDDEERALIQKTW